jgi:pentose-5-phosphate-3-epimerase
MVEDPAAFIRPMALAGCDEFVFHIEACRYPRRVKSEIEDSGMIPGVAIYPATSVSALESVADLPSVTVMTVEPGFAGQDFIATSPERVNRARMLFGISAAIFADGHINPATARLLAAAGATGFVCGTKSLFQGAHEVSAYAQALEALRAALPGRS